MKPAHARAETASIRFPGCIPARLRTVFSCAGGFTQSAPLPGTRPRKSSSISRQTEIPIDDLPPRSLQRGPYAWSRGGGERNEGAWNRGRAALRMLRWGKLIPRWGLERSPAEPRRFAVDRVEIRLINASAPRRLLTASGLRSGMQRKVPRAEVPRPGGRAERSSIRRVGAASARLLCAWAVSLGYFRMRLGARLPGVWRVESARFLV